MIQGQESGGKLNVGDQRGLGGIWAARLWAAGSLTLCLGSVPDPRAQVHTPLAMLTTLCRSPGPAAVALVRQLLGTALCGFAGVCRVAASPLGALHMADEGRGCSPSSFLPVSAPSCKPDSVTIESDSSSFHSSRALLPAAPAFPVSPPSCLSRPSRVRLGLRIAPGSRVGADFGAERPSSARSVDQCCNSWCRLR